MRSSFDSPCLKRASFSGISFFVFSVEGAPTKETKKIFMAYNSVIFSCPLAVSFTEEETEQRNNRQFVIGHQSHDLFL